MEFGRKLRLLRVARGMSQIALGKLTGIPDSYISAIETGKLTPTPEWEARLRDALDWPANADEAFAILENR